MKNTEPYLELNYFVSLLNREKFNQRVSDVISFVYFVALLWTLSNSITIINYFLSLLPTTYTIIERLRYNEKIENMTKSGLCGLKITSNYRETLKFNKDDFIHDNVTVMLKNIRRFSRFSFIE